MTLLLLQEETDLGVPWWPSDWDCTMKVWVRSLVGGPTFKPRGLAKILKEKKKQTQTPERQICKQPEFRSHAECEIQAIWEDCNLHDKVTGDVKEWSEVPFIPKER